MDDPVRLALSLAVLVFSCVFHECAHVWTAWRLGDPTGKQLGRLTLNPVPHIDFFWTILMPLLCLATGMLVIGGPKPAPVNPLNFRNPRLGHTIVSLAGPASNVLLAVAGVVLLSLASHSGTDWIPADSYNAFVLMACVFINVVLAALNMIPLPPLDGSRVLHYMLGPRADQAFAAMERISLFLVLAAFYLLGPYVVRPALLLLGRALAIFVKPDYLELLFRTY
jgi:Zn-dependent protease